MSRRRHGPITGRPRGDRIDLAGATDVCGTHFDVCLRCGHADPPAGSVQCPIGSRTSCVSTPGGPVAVLGGGVASRRRPAADQRAARDPRVTDP